MWIQMAIMVIGVYYSFEDDLRVIVTYIYEDDKYLYLAEDP